MGNGESTYFTEETEQTAAAAAAAAANDDEPWWYEIEHENLILEQVPVQQTFPRENQSVPTSMFPLSTAKSSTVDTLKKNENADGKHENAVEAEAAVAAAITKLTVESLEAVQREQTLEEFKEELRSKRLARQTAVQDLREEINSLRKQLATEQAESRRLRKQQDNAETATAEAATAEAATAVAATAVAATAEAAAPDDYYSYDVNKVDSDDEDPTLRSRHANIELASAQLALQMANADNLQLRGELDVVQKQVGTLKEVISCCKQMLSVKEEQCAQLKMKLTEIENSFSEREMKIMSNNLRQEYERQLVNIRQLRQLYEERQRVAAAEYENLQRLISIKKDELLAEQEKTKNFEERNQTLLKEVETANNELAKMREECNEHKYEKRTLKEQMGAVNMLFSQMVMGFNGKNNLDIDRLTKMLEENRDLLNEMTQAEGSCSDGASLPKLLFELVEQADLAETEEQSGHNKSRSVTPTPTAAVDATAALDASAAAAETETTLETVGDDVTDSVSIKPGGSSSCLKKHRRRSGVSAMKCSEPEIMDKVASAQEIIGNLPKVWKVLMELLSHHKIERVQFEELPKAEECHKMGGTGNGNDTASSASKAPELSVSKTYIKLKDLILEKKSLVKETNRLKTLNSHLDYRLNEQETRLSAVSLELTKTWHLVGKMQRQHRQLHTQEQILRYQLQQKRRLLSELKDELEYCRRKWAAARAKNDESQEQCDDLRREFARRKLEDANHSAESGYSDSGPQSDEETMAAAAAASVAVTAADATPAVGGGTVGASAVAANVVVGNCRRKHLRDQFEHTRRIKRMQSTSPGRAAAVAAEEGDEIVLRWNSAPPTCGWRVGDDDDDADDEDVAAGQQQLAAEELGAIAKAAHKSRNRQRSNANNLTTTGASSTTTEPLNEDVTGRASRIQRLEEQCKSLIQQVLETSGNRERLEIQLCRFQDEIAPVQHAVPLDEFINRKRIERMTRASSVPTGSLTPREEEYTRKRSERLGRLEEESRQLMSRIKRTTDRGHYLRKSLDRIRRAPSREASFESNTEDEVSQKTEAIKSECSESEESSTKQSPLTAEEQAYTSRRAARIARLEQESQLLINQLKGNTERGDNFSSKLDTLHERHDQANRPSTSATAAISQTVEQRLEDIERVSANRAERLRLMEAQGKELIARLSSTSERGTAMINRIAEREASRRQEAELVEQTVATEEATSQLNNIASSRIVGEDAEGTAACCVTVTTTSTQLAAVQQSSTGAIPKTKPQAQLCAAVRQVDATKKRTLSKETKESEAVQPESLEDMVLRLRNLPFPTAKESSTTEEAANVPENNNEDIQNSQQSEEKH